MVIVKIDLDEYCILKSSCVSDLPWEHPSVNAKVTYHHAVRNLLLLILQIPIPTGLDVTEINMRNQECPIV